MIEGLLNFIKKSIGIQNKYTLINDLNTTITQFENNIIPELEKLKTLLNGVKDFSSDENKDIVNSIYKNIPSDVKVSVNKNISSDLIYFCKNIVENARHSLSVLEKLNNKISVKYNISNLKLFHIRAVGHYYFLSRYIIDLMNYLYINEVKSIEKEPSKSYELKKAQIEKITKNAYTFAKLLSVYGLPPKVFIEKLDRLDEVMINEDVDESAVQAYADKKIDLSIPQNFIGSPIYAIRLMIAEWEADRLKELKDTKRLLELRYMHFKLLKERGESDPSIEKELEYLQNKITDLDYKIKKMYEGVEDEQY